ncbi:MAG: DUF1801 domain-containing protein [Bacteroidales bacterium]
MKSDAKDIDVYIGQQPEKVKEILTELRNTISKAVPEAEELISYKMPAFRFHGMLVWYAPFKNHYSIFVRPHILKNFKEDLKAFETSKSNSAIKIPHNRPVPVDLLTRILKLGAKINLKNEKLKTKRK